MNDGHRSLTTDALFNLLILDVGPWWSPVSTSTDCPGFSVHYSRTEHGKFFSFSPVKLARNLSISICRCVTAVSREAYRKKENNKVKSKLKVSYD